MNLFTQKNTSQTLKIFIYTIAGAIGSLLLLFLVKQSLPIEQEETKNYHQDIQKLQQDIYHLQKKNLQLFYSLGFSGNDFEIQLKNIHRKSIALSKLKIIKLI